MTEETSLVTVRMPEEMLEDLDSMYGEDKDYDSRTDVVEDSLNLLIGKRQKNDINPLYDAAVTSYLNALSREKYDLAKKARNHITDNFSDTLLAEELEPDTLEDDK